MDKQIIEYEQPLNERIRTFLRLEMLFTQTRHTLHGESNRDSRLTMSSIIDILNIFERGDLKSEVIKELDRHIANFHRLKTSPGVDEPKLTQVLNKLQRQTESLQKMMGKFGHRLKEIELIAAVKQRLSIPGGTCDFDIPMYHHWLQQPCEVRTGDLESWFADFSPIEESVDLLLRLTRESAVPYAVVANNGFYQKPLELNTPCQLVTVRFDKKEHAIAEISGGRHRISIRFLEGTTRTRPTQVQRDIPFELSCCII